MRVRFFLLAFFVSVTFSANAQIQPAAAPPRSIGKDLMVKGLSDLPGKEVVVRANEYPPGTSNPPHRHDAHVFLHILEGQLIVQLKGGAPVTLNAGDTYYESPTDIHVMSRNPSATASVKTLIFMVKEKGAPATTLVKD